MEILQCEWYSLRNRYLLISTLVCRLIYVGNIYVFHQISK
jgi:hypothetical protein